jgi:choline-sulfatase
VKRRTLPWILAGGALVVFLGLFRWPVLTEPQSTARGPIVVILIDTLRADRLPAYGYATGRTPAIDAFVADGILFERAYTHSPQTLPAHVSILSGHLPQHHGVRDNVGFTVRVGQKLLPHWLREHGFATGGVVSTAVLREATGIGAGFDFYDGRMPPVRGGAALDEAQRDGHASLAIAQNWIQQQGSRDWFLFLHLYEPHAPYRPPPRYQHLAPYDGEIAYADEIVGKFLQHLRASKSYEASTIVLLSDHGEGLGDHGEQEHGLFLYEEALHVPWVVKLPGQGNAGTRVPHLVQHIDLLPTLLDLAGVPVPANLPGRSLRPLLDARPDRWPDRRIYSEALFGRFHFGWSELFTLTDSKFKFIQAPRPELYDLLADPRERHNLAETMRPAARAMSRALSELVDDANVETPKKLTPEAQQQLASLGYLGPKAGAGPSTTGETLPDPKDKVHLLARYRSAMEHEAEGRPVEAMNVLKLLVRDEPAMVALWQTIGRLCWRLGRASEAVNAYREYVRQQPTSVAGLLELASVLLALQRLEEAQLHAELAATVAVEKERAEVAGAYELLAKIALARRDDTRARHYASLAADIDPGFPLKDYVEGRIAYAAGRFEDASAFFERGVKASGSVTNQIRGLHLYAGDALAHLQRFAEAERSFHQEIRFFADNTWAYLSLANLYQTFGRAEEADRVLDAMLRTVPSAQAHAEARKLRAARAPLGGRP